MVKRVNKKDGKRNTKPSKKEKAEWCSQDGWFKDGIPSNLPGTPFKYVDGKQEEKERYARKFIRCPTCNKRLKPKAIFCNAGGEFISWGIPKHKAK